MVHCLGLQHGESHGPTVGCVVDGCPAGINISASEIQADMDRRRPGQSRITTQRKEGDEIEILSGLFEGVSMGTPIAIMVRNEDARSKDYSEMSKLYRPSHADYTYQAKYGMRDWRGGGRSSAVSRSCSSMERRERSGKRWCRNPWWPSS